MKPIMKAIPMTINGMMVSQIINFSLMGSLFISMGDHLNWSARRPLENTQAKFYGLYWVCLMVRLLSWW